MSASQHEPLMPQSQTPRLPFKVRSSCDACGQAKIKCDRGQPACARCVAQGVSCVYGVSQRAGKGKRKPPRRWPATPSPFSSSPDEPETTSIDPTGGGHHGIDTILSLADGDLSLDYPFLASDAAFQTWFPFDSLSGLDALTPISSDQDTWMSGQSSSALKPGESSTTTTTTTTTATATVAAAVRPCCTRKSKDIMRRLYCANPSTPISDGVLASTLDLGSVLTRNRDVVTRLGLLLKCSCARSPHMVMLYASIVSRVLLWYGQAAWNASPAGVSSLSSFPPTLAAQETMSSLSSSNTLKNFDAGAADDNRGVSVLPTPVMVGTFQSDNRNLQTALTNCLILSELRRVGGLIDSFISLGTGTSDLQAAGDACPAAGEFSTSVADASLFASLGAWLRTEHGRIVRRAKSGLSVLDDNLSC